jgi:hypothetical protein
LKRGISLYYLTVKIFLEKNKTLTNAQGFIL